MACLRIVGATVGGLLAGVALVVACGTGPSDTSAQTITPTNVVDGAGVVLGKLVGSAPLFSSIPPVPPATFIQIYPAGWSFAFMDSSGHVWNVGVGGSIQNPKAGTFFASVDCTGDAYSPWQSTQVPVFDGVGFYVATGAPPASINVQSALAWNVSGCTLAAPGPSPSTFRLLAKVTPPTVTAPIRIQ